ncbi:hypothetical protein TCAL_04806 [Tigriopus californicus]|uniref:Peptidase M28 domain-containing protein n=1 Tax=Tigriopus californicus TaxID=6832 RepID=A0A553PRW1_TIGCA|nr:hypothetical protein TCAL_04806 [Tigriopus californicus]
MGWVKIITFCVGGFILGGVVFFVTGWFTAPYSETISNEDESKLAIIKRLTKNKWNAFDIQEDLNKVSPDSMRNFLLELSKEPHLAGSDRDEYLAGWIKSQWEAFGLDVVDQVKYQMLLSYPDPAKPNMITLQDDEHGLLFENSVIEDGVEAEGTEDVYPDSFWLPESGIQRGSSFLGHGDPETPGWPSLDNVYRVPDDVLAKRLPPIPAQPIGYKDAAVILGAMSGELVPPDWMGGIAGVEYRLGGSFDPEKCATNCRLSIEVNNKLERKVSSNVVGILRGSEEPDRYVLLGNHRDAWGYGAVDPSSGTAQMMEVVRILGQKANTTEWRPRRSMVFLSWGAEEYGLMGSTEFTEHYLTKLKERAIVYINCDICVAGSVLKSFSTPTVNHKLLQATKVVPSPFNPEQSYYEFWHNWTSQGDSGNSEPVTNLPAAGSDHAFFIYELGIPVIDFSVKPDFHEYPNLEFYNYPTYHTGFETFALVDEILDPGFKQHQVCAGLNLVMGRSLADDLLLDFDPKQYYQLMKTSVDDFTTSGVEDKLLSLNLTLKHVRSAVQEFNDTAALWNTRRSSKAIVEDPLALRILNDQVMKLDRTFLLPEGLPRRTEFRHAIISPSEHDSYGAGSFPGISDLLFHFDSLTSQEQGDRTKQLDRHLSDLMILIKNAANFLKNPEMIV